MNLFWTSLPLILFVAISALMFGVLFAFRKYHKLKERRASATQEPFRLPGESLFKQLDHLNEEIYIHLVYLIILPLLAYATIISSAYFGSTKLNTSGSWIAAILCPVLIAYFIFKLAELRSRRRHIRLEYEGKLTVGQALNQLMLQGYHVYHDFPADEFNIDHIVVGMTGVFAVETKTRSKRTARDRVEDATVTYDGRMLYYPKDSDHETIDQAKRQASWLSTWLSAAVGEPFAVRAIVAIPGWIVKRTSADGIPVVNPKQFSTLFEHIKPRYLSNSQIAAFSNLLDQKYRDLEPKTAQIVSS